MELKRIFDPEKWCFSCAVLLFGVTGIVKLFAVATGTAALGELDPVFHSRYHTIILVAGVLEVFVAAYCMWGKSEQFKHAAIAWLSACILLYRLGFWLLSPTAQCPCLGFAYAPPVVVEHSFTYLLFALLMGSTLFLFRKKVRHYYALMNERNQIRLKRCALAVVVLALIPAVQVAAVGIFNPPITGPAALRIIKSSVRGTGPNTTAFLWKPGSAVPDDVFRAVLSAEDRRFFQHHGFDWSRIRVALYSIVAKGRPQGVSTITQQCARSLFLWQGRSWIRKGLEAYYTIWMELLLSKRRILELYVNVIEFGDGIYGIEAAARHFYKKSARDLTREETAMLVAILPAPKRWNPLKPTETVKNRQEAILQGMGEVCLPWEVADSDQAQAGR